MSRFGWVISAEQTWVISVKRSSFQPTLDEEESGELGVVEEGDEEVLLSAPGFRPAKLGGWYYIAHHRLYARRHPEGLWGGENALYIGRDEVTGEQLWSGLGLHRVTEEEMAGHCAEEFNKPPTAGETETILRDNPRYLPLVLPVLGDLSSVSQLPPLTAASFLRLENLWQHANPGTMSGLRITRQVVARGILRALLKDRPLEPPTRARDLLETFRVGELEEPSGEGATRLGTWQRGDGEVTLTWTNETVKKTSVYSLIDHYRSAYNLSLVRQLVDLFRERNPAFEDRGSKSMFPVAPGAVFPFPLPSALAKLYKTPGGFQAVGSKRLSVPRIEELRGRP